MMNKDASNAIKDFEWSKKKRNNSYTERKDACSIKLNQDQQILKEKPKAACDQELLLDLHTSVLTEELDDVEEHFQEKYAKSEQEILQLLLEENLDVDDKSSQRSQIDVLEQQFRRAIISHQEWKQKSKEAFLLTHSTSLHQDSFRMLSSWCSKSMEKWIYKAA